MHEVDETSDQLPGESDGAYRRYRIYRDLPMGRRSLRAAYARYSEALEAAKGEGNKRQRKAGKGSGLPGQWGRLSVRFRWRGRAAAHDIARLQREGERAAGR